MIALDQCEDGALYRVRARNFHLGVFRKKTSGFIGVRHKFGNTYLFEEYHWDAPAFATVMPIEKLAVCPIRPLSERNDELFAWMVEQNVVWPDDGVGWSHE